MAGYLTASEVTCVTGIYANHFTTFSRNIVVNKEPKKTITQQPNPNYHPGYGESSIAQEQVTFTPVSGIYPAIVRYANKQREYNSPDLDFNISQGEVLIKVQQPARVFINEGKTENFIIDGLTFNEIADEKVQDYLGLQYYYYLLRRTK